MYKINMENKFFRFMIYLNVICILFIVFDVPYYIMPMKVVHCSEFSLLNCYFI